MDIEIRDLEDWVMVSIGGRVDAFNCESLTSQIDKLIKAGRIKFAFDLEKAKFLSLPSIKYISNVATDITHKGGECALVGPSEKIKRQIDIFASLKPMKLYRHAKDWEEYAALKSSKKAL